MPRATVPTLAWPIRCFPTIQTAGRFALADKEFDYQYLAPTLAMHIYNYVARIRIGADEFELIPGDLTFTPPGVASRYHLPRPGMHWCIHLFQPQGPGQDHDTVSLPVHLRLGSMRRHVEQEVVEIARLLTRGRNNEPAALAAAEGRLQTLLLEIAMLAQSKGAGIERTASHIAVDLVASILCTRLAEPLTVPDLAAEVGISQNYLARQFRSRYGSTIPHFLLQQRVDAARDLLRNTDIPIHVIATRVGLGNPQYFNKQFRRLAGISPSTWRNEARKGVSKPCRT